MEELHEEEMYCLIAPDGSPQLMTLAPDFPMCYGVIKLLEESGTGQSPEKLFKRGYKIFPVKITVTQNGTEETAFEKIIEKRKQ